MSREPVTVRRRWGVQIWNDHPSLKRVGHWATLGHGWIRDAVLPPSVDFWPASYRTRREARTAVKTLTERAREHSSDWRFREVRLHIEVRESS